MFTGLVQSIGRIRRNSQGVEVDGCEKFSPLIIGDSIAVDGVCLTVAKVIGNSFLADVSEETLKKTTLGPKSEKGGVVNLEPALRLSDRLGGHLVSGHVDGLGEVCSVKELPNSWDIKVEWKNKNFGKYICDKASISLNGISLTVSSSNIDGSSFAIAVIPHTWANTSLNYLKTGELVNLEADLMAKYAEKLINKNVFIKNNPPKNFDSSVDISSDWLKDQGWN